MREVPPVDKTLTIKLVRALKYMNVVYIAWNNAYLCLGSQGPFIRLVDPHSGVSNHIINC